MFCTLPIYRDYKLSGLITFLRKYVPFHRNYINVKRGSAFFAPKTQMNTYNLNKLFMMIQKADVHNCYVEFTNHGGELGLIIYFQKEENLA